MKKRLISMLLAVLMVASLFGGMSISAYAAEDYETQEYTVKEGDTLFRICNKLGLNWFNCEPAIQKLNGLSGSDYTRLSVGQSIDLPASNEDALKIMKASTGSTTTITGGTTTTTGGTGSTTTTTTTGGTSANAAYWLIPYTMQKGETVVGVCNTLGISFTAYGDQIKKLNNISAWNKVPAGKTLLLPSPSAPVAGTSCYAVVAHQIQKGETTYSICNEYGVSYNANANLLQNLNTNTSLTSIKYGRTLYVPVPTVISTASSSGSGTVISGGGSTSSGSSSTGSGTSSTTKTYKLSASSNSTGKVTFAVNGVAATSAAAGAKVFVKVTPTTDYSALKSIKLTRADGGAALEVSNGYFTMPASDVNVVAVFGTGYYVGPLSGNGTINVTVNGVPPVTVAKDVTVKVDVTPDYGYTVKEIQIIRNDGSNAVYATIKNGETFKMPDCRVFVKAIYDTVPVYTLSKQTNLNGTFKLQVNGTDVTKAPKDAVVVICPEPVAGYEFDADNTSVSFVNGAGKTEKVVVNDYKFYMPAADVKVNVAFKKCDETIYSITVKNVSGGRADAVNSSGKVITSAVAGTAVTLVAEPFTGYSLSGYTIEGNGSSKIPVDGKFTMPAGNVVITPKFVEGKAITASATNGSKLADFGTVKFSVNGAATDNAPEGAQVKVQVTPVTGYAVERIMVGSTEVANGGTFTMPNAAVEVKVTFKSVAVYAFTHVSDGNGTFVLRVDGVDVEAAAAGAAVEIVPMPKEGYAVDTIKVTTKTGKIINVNNNKFSMPTEDVTVDLSFKASTTFSITVVNNEQGYAVATITTKGGSEEVVNEAAKGAKINVETVAKPGYAIPATGNKYTVAANGDVTGYSEASFTMPAGDVVITPIFVPAERYLVIDDPTHITVMRDGEKLENNGIVKTGDVLTITAKLNGYTETIKVNDELLVGDKYTVKADNASVVVTVEYKANMNKVTVAKAEHGSITVDAANASWNLTNISEAGTAWELKVNDKADDGYYLSTFSVKVDGSTEEAKVYKFWDGVSKFVMPAGDVTITPVFKAKDNKLTIDVDPSIRSSITVKIGDAEATNLGSTSIPLAVKSGEKVVFTYTADSGYLIVDSTGTNKVTIADNNTKVVTITMPAGDASITIK